jgi:hypothetical protein
MKNCEMNFRELYKKENDLIKPNPDFIELLVTEMKAQPVMRKHAWRISTVVASAAAACLVMIFMFMYTAEDEGGFIRGFGGENRAAPEAISPMEDGQDMYNSNRFSVDFESDDAENGVVPTAEEPFPPARASTDRANAAASADSLNETDESASFRCELSALFKQRGLRNFNNETQQTIDTIEKIIEIIIGVFYGE